MSEAYDGPPTCPKCGCNEFKFDVLQQVRVVFFDAGDDEDGEDHMITQDPEGDMEWDDDTEATCTDCDHCAPLKAMVPA